VRGVSFSELRLALLPPERRDGRYVRAGRADLENLLQIVQAGEGRAVDFVRDVPPAPDSAEAMELAHLLCSFANGNDGTVYVGVERPPEGQQAELESLPGVDLGKAGLCTESVALDAWLQALVTANLSPPELDAIVHPMQVDKSCVILAIEVTKSGKPPCVCGDGSVWVRGPGARPATADDIAALLAEPLRKSLEAEVFQLYEEQIGSIQTELGEERSNAEKVRDQLSDATKQRERALEEVEKLRQQLEQERAARRVPRPTTGVEVLDCSDQDAKYHDLRRGTEAYCRHDEVTGTWSYALSKHEEYANHEPGWVPDRAVADPDYPGLYLVRERDWLDIIDHTYPDPARHRHFFSCRYSDLSEFWHERALRCGLDDPSAS